MDPRPNPVLPLDSATQLPLHTLFALQARRTPNAIALADMDREISFAALERSINAMAVQLTSLGMQKNDLVAIWADRAITLPVAMLGVMAAGGSFLILDPQYPTQRLATMTRIACPRAVIVLSTAPQIPHELSVALNGTPRVSLGPDLDDKVRDAPIISVTADDQAYIAFTSGTTGVPKAIVGRHAPVSHFLQWYLERFRFGECDRFAMLSGLAHDPLLRDIMTPLVSGGTLIVPPRDSLKDPQSLRALLVEERISAIHLTPSLGQLLLHCPEQTIGYRTIPSLRWAFFGGEPLKYGIVSQFCKLAPNTRVVNFYGATETPQAMGYWEVESDHEDRSGVVPVGRGIADVQLLVVRESGELAPIGEVGEIYIRTPFLAQGYLQQLDQMEQRFVSNWFSNDRVDRLYRTGDLGVYRHDGVVELCGRSDRQVKIRGFRVELDEVEAAIAQHAKVRQSAVEFQEDAMVAYIASKQPVTSIELRQFVRRTLPDYMVPSVFIAVESIPLTPNGKIDRKALPPVTEYCVLSETSVSDMNEVESRLAKIWSEVLHMPQIKRTDSFFDLGGDSMKGLELLLRVEKAFGRSLPVNSLLRAPSVGEMAAILQHDALDTRSKMLVSIRDTGQRLPIYWLPGGGGLSVMAFRRLSYRLGVDRPVLGLEAELDPSRAPETLTALVQAYKKEILAQRSQGPFHLFGFSLGSFVAYELAVQLRAEGHEVGVLAVFDTAVPVMMNRFAKLALRYYRLQYLWSEFRRHGAQKALQRDRQHLSLPKAGTNFERICQRNIRAIHDYAAKPLPPYDGKVTCIVARESWMHDIPSAIDPRLAWAKSAKGGVEALVVPGDHLSMLEMPGVDALAKVLRDALRRFEVRTYS